MEQNSLDTSKDESLDIVEPTAVNKKRMTAGVVGKYVDYTVPANRDWFQVTVRDGGIQNDSIVVASGCFLDQHGIPIHRNNEFFIYAVTPRRPGFIYIRVGANDWNNKKVRINMMIQY